jgi:predicted NAD/FAD-binding protein
MMLRELLRFYREAPIDALTCGDQPLEAYLNERGYGRAFRDDHLYPMGAAIWSATAAGIGDYPVAAFVRFCQNHGLLQVNDRPVWRTVDGGSREYVQRLTAGFADRIHRDQPVVAVERSVSGTRLRTRRGEWSESFDHVVLACHADQALQMLPTLSEAERRVLGAFTYTRNHAVLHRDPALMPRRRAVWCSWNYLADRGSSTLPTLTYWMNRLQPHLDEQQGPGAAPLFVTLNPAQPPRPEHLIRTEVYEHPRFDARAIAAQRELWSLQGGQRTWFCGAYFGSGFHEDGLQAGLAVAEALGGVKRPWAVADESGRIHLPQAVPA